MKRFSFVFLMIALFSFSYGQSRTDTFHVANYVVNIENIDFVARTLSGCTELDVVVLRDGADAVRLDLISLEVDSVAMNGSSAQFSRVGDHLFVDLPQQRSGDTLHIAVHYHGAPVHDDNFGGFYFSGEYAYNVGVALHSQPHNYARCWFPCMDEFTDKSSYTFKITLPEGKMAVCNGTLIDSASIGDGKKTWHWRLDEIIPTYLASMAVGPYRCFSDTIHGLEAVIPVGIYTPPAIYDNIAGSFVNLKTIFRMFEEKFGAYRWPRIGYVCTAMTGGAMEHATNIAYPNLFVNGGTTYQDVYAHELFHHWFGDLITCEKAEEMWINEGFASFCEPLVNGLLYSSETKDAYIKHIRNTHSSVLQNIVRNDGGHFALDNVPQEVTYGTHSYQKGALVIHTLKSYMGDSLFFTSLRSLLDHYAYKNVGSEDFFSTLSEISGMDLTDFYNDWIHQPGFLDFYYKDVSAHGCGIYTVKVMQSGYGTEHYGRNIPIDITFVSFDNEFHTFENQMITDDSTEFLLYVPFSPKFVILDRNSKLSDATLDVEKMLTQTGISNFNSEVSCSVDVTTLPDTTFLRIEHHYTSPSVQGSLPEGIHKISETHYWDVQYSGDYPEGRIMFKLLRGNSNQLDYSLFDGGYTNENVKLLYREKAGSEWTIVPFTKSGTPYNVTVSTFALLPGQYCFAIGDKDVSVGEKAGDLFQVYPSPADDRIFVCSGFQNVTKVSLFDSTGRCVKSSRGASNRQEINVSDLKPGAYVVVLYDKRKTLARDIFVKK